MSDKNLDMINESLSLQIEDILEKSKYTIDAVFNNPDGTKTISKVRPLITPEIIRLTLDIKKVLEPKEVKKGGFNLDI